MPRYRVKVVDISFDVYEVEAEDAAAAEEKVADIHCQDGTSSPHYVEGGVSEREYETSSS